MKLFLLLLLLITLQSSKAENNDGFSNFIFDHSENESYLFDHLFLESVDIETYKKLDTITYYVTDKNHTNNTLSSAFDIFSEDIGVNNGAVYFSLENGVINKNKSNTFEFIDASTCDPMIFKKDSIIVEFRNRKSCIRIPTKDQSIIISVLVMIKKNIGNFDNIESRTNMIKLINSIEAELENRNIPIEHYEVAESFILILKNKLHDIILGFQTPK